MVADRGHERNGALATVRTIRSYAVKYLPGLRRCNDPDLADMIDLLEDIIQRTERWKKKAKPKTGTYT